MCEQCFPDTELELMHEVDDHHPEDVKRLSKLLKERILYGIQSDATDRQMRKVLTATGTEDVDLSIPPTLVPATACPNL